MVPVRPIAPAPGARLASENIIGRDDDVARFWRVLTTTTAPLLLTEPRRLGKTLTLRKLCEDKPDGWVATYRSYQGVDTVAGLCQALLNDLADEQGLPARLRGRVREFLAGSTVTVKGVTLKLAPEFSDDPIAALDAALSAVSAELGERQLVLVCDEVPDMIAGIRQQEGSEAALRAMALWRSHREEAANANIHWILTGSVGFHHIVRLLGRADLINDLMPIALGPLGPDWTRWLAESVLLGAGVTAPSPAAVEELARLSGGFAMIIHLVGALVRDRSLTDVEASAVAGLLDQAFGDLDATQQLTSFLTRLAPYYGADEPLALWLLDRAARGPADRAELLADGRFRDEEHLRALLDSLTADHYLVHDDDSGARQYAWRYEPMRRLWAQRRR